MNRRCLTVREHQDLLREPFGPLNIDAFDAFSRHLSALPANALTPIHHGLRTGSFCGLVSAAGWTLEILPKIYDQPGDGPDRGLLVRMLESCFDVPLWQGGAADSDGADLLPILARTFLEEASAQMRLGWIKSYVTFADQLTRPRGQLKLQEQLRRGRAQGHKLHCEFDELTVDNVHNQFVKAALQVVSSIVPMGSRHAITVRRLAATLDEVADIHSSIHAGTPPSTHRLTRRYDRLLLLSSWLLRLLGPDVHGGSERGLSLLFDMNRLFQDYVGHVLDAAIQRHPLRERLNLARERPVKHLVANGNRDMRFQLRPDFCLQFDDEIIAIFDTKWKRLQPLELNAAVGQSDLYQLLAYGHTYGCRELMLIYPHAPALNQWQKPDFRFAPFDSASIQLSVETFDLENAESSADRIIAAMAVVAEKTVDPFNGDSSCL
ncbi:5-methylcytosine-specific restriction enzyme subunit McrC [Burkholderia sp. D7]|nr:5-methylcytosine-specific restriction enzyme subunit McrC [Burkholderia sp. D7]